MGFFINKKENCYEKEEHKFEFNKLKELLSIDVDKIKYVKNDVLNLLKNINDYSNLDHQKLRKIIIDLYDFSNKEEKKIIIKVYGELFNLDKPVLENKKEVKIFLNYLIEKGYATQDQIKALGNFFDYSFAHLKSKIEDNNFNIKKRKVCVELLYDICEFYNKKSLLFEYFGKLVENVGINKDIRDFARKFISI